MNKLLLSFAFCLTTITSFAQEAADRMMVHQKDGSVRSYAISNVDSVTFGKSDVQGDVTVTVLASMGSLAYVPLSEMFGYATDLRSKTQGRANYSMFFT